MFTAAFAVLILLTSLLFSWLSQKTCRIHFPPGPPRFPIVGNLLQLTHLPHRDFASFSAKYGPLVYLKLGAVNAITTDDPEVIREILQRQDKIFASRPRTRAALHLAYRCDNVALAPMGPQWKRMRRICMENLLTTKRLESFGSHRIEEARYLVNEILDHARAGKVVDMRRTLSAFSMNNVTRMLFGKQFFGDEKSEEAAEFVEITRQFFHLLGLIYVGDYLPFWRWFDPAGCEKKMREVEMNVDKFYQRIIDEHKKKKRINGGAAVDEEDMDFVDVLLTLPGEDGQEHMDDREIKALIQDMIAAATDTSSVTIEWAMTELIKHPHILHKVQDELDTVVGRARMVAESNLPSLTYLRCVVRETFRMHPAAPFLIPHESVKPTKLMGYDIPYGTRIFINTYGLGRNTRIWDDIDKFRPERHLPDEKGRKVEISHGSDFLILPFGAGRRKCPGAPLGLMMVLMGLARLCHCFDWCPPDGVGTEEIDVEEVYGLTMPKAQPLMAMARPRLDP